MWGRLHVSFFTPYSPCSQVVARQCKVRREGQRASWASHHWQQHIHSCQQSVVILKYNISEFIFFSHKRLQITAHNLKQKVQIHQYNSGWKMTNGIKQCLCVLTGADISFMVNHTQQKSMKCLRCSWCTTNNWDLSFGSTSLVQQWALGGWC